jgi:mono/diheme cytochrome c family protein
MISAGERLYRAHCAACHGEGGAGDGVIGRSLAPDGASERAGKLETMADSMAGFGHRKTAPADFTDPAVMLGASPALLEGKIIRGGMGTGMPYWGPIFRERQLRALVDYLWSFQFDRGGGHARGPR